jgi:hypothetical protein
MSNTVKITGDNFKAQLKRAVTADKSLRALLQRLVVFGFKEYDEGKNSNWLTDVINADLKGVRMAAIQQYIEDHTDLVLTKMSSDDIRFKREAREGYTFVMPTVTWYEYSKIGQVTFVDPMAAFKGLITKLENAEDSEKEKRQLVDGTKETADAMLVYLKAYPAFQQQAAA